MTADGQAGARRGGPLAGVRVLSLESYLAGNHVTYLLSLFGAEIIKVEQPGVGDALRGSASGAGHLENKQQNKKSLALDVSKPAGLRVFQRLVSHADVVFTNQKLTTLRRFGIDFDMLAKHNPRIVYTTLSGFGHGDIVPEGPFGRWPAFDVIAQGLSGLQFRCLGREEDAPGYNGIALGDDGTAILAVLGTVLALRARDTTGDPQRVDVAMHDSMIYYNGSAVNRMRAQGTTAPRGRSSGGSAPYGAYPTGDGWVNIAVWGAALWGRFCLAIGRPEVEHEPRFATPQARLDNVEALEKEVVLPFTQARTNAEVVAALHAQGIPVAPVLEIEAVVESPQVAARQLFTDCYARDGELSETLGSPIKASFVDEHVPLTAPPQLGEHSRELLVSLLEIEQAELDELVGADIVQVHEHPGSFAEASVPLRAPVDT